MMRHPTARMTPNTVTLRKVVAWTLDKAGGRQPTYGTDSDPIACAVQPTNANDMPAHMRESEVIYTTVKFYSDPGLRVRDLILFGTRQIVVSGVRSTSGGAGRTFVVLAEERPGGGV
jgi:hypothetical protein